MGLRAYWASGVSPPLGRAKWNARAVMRLIAGACARAGVASSPAMMERKILRSVSMMRLPMRFPNCFVESSRSYERLLRVNGLPGVTGWDPRASRPLFSQKKKETGHGKRKRRARRPRSQAPHLAGRSAQGYHPPREGDVGAAATPRKPSFPRQPNRDTLGQAHTGAVWVHGGISLQ